MGEDEKEGEEMEKKWKKTERKMVGAAHPASSRRGAAN
jgi:hypothetical protein